MDTRSCIITYLSKDLISGLIRFRPDLNQIQIRFRLIRWKIKFQLDIDNQFVHNQIKEINLIMKINSQSNLWIKSMDEQLADHSYIESRSLSD